MRVDDFDFDLPRELIAEHPIEPRDAAKLLVIGDRLSDRRIADLPQLLRAGDVLVANDTRVIPARLTGTRGAATIEVTLHLDRGGGEWRAFVKGARRIKASDTIRFADDFRADVIEKSPEGDVVLCFSCEGAALKAQLERHGRMPLPPYIHRDRVGDPRDRHDYQTMFAAKDGAVAAPTAGLHFTPSLLAALKDAGIGLETVTLHVGAGTFLPGESPRHQRPSHARRIQRHRCRRLPRAHQRERAPKAAASSLSAPRACGYSKARRMKAVRSGRSPPRPHSSSRPAMASGPSMCC